MSRPSSIQRLRRQVILTELGLRAATKEGVEALAAHTAHTVADACGAPLVGVFELREGALHLLAGVGWPPYLAVQAIVCDGDPHLAEILAADGPVSLPDVAPRGLARAGVESGLSVRVGDVDAPLGVLGTYKLDRSGVDDEVPEFLDAVAQVLARALEQAHTEAALRESEARMRAILKGSADGLLTFDEDGAIESANPAAEQMFGYEAGTLLGRSIHALLPTPSANAARTALGAVRPLDWLAEEAVGCRADGTTFPMRLSLSQIAQPTGTLYTSFVRDVTEQRTLEREVLRIADAERRRIGQDLHDGLGQLLTGTAMIAQSVARKLDRDDRPEAGQAEEVVALLRQADAQARALARGLVPVDLEANGLQAALERLAANATHFFEVACTMTCRGSRPTSLPETVPVHVFRIAQEAVSNAVRHGKADQVTIDLGYEPSRVTLQVTDDGRGYPASEPLCSEPPLSDSSFDNRGMGVRIMRYRAHLLGGRFEIRPGDEGGTVVSCTVPLDP
ncbi:MAG: PAS domain S-box protein [Bacteroidota bacterium]